MKNLTGARGKFVAALTPRMHRWPILCRRGNEIGHFAGKRSHVDVWKAYNGDFASTRTSENVANFCKVSYQFISLS